MTKIFPDREAKLECIKLMKELDASKLNFSLNSPGKGKHFGILVCSDGTILKAFSGMLEGSYTLEGFVPPCLNNPLEALKSKDYLSLHKAYVFNCYDGTEVGVPDYAPTGTGECCEIKLLSYCYKIRKKPRSFASFFYGSGSFPNKSFTTPCDSRCSKILKYILGIDIIFYDEQILVVNKPAGVLSIEGRGPDKQDSIAFRVKSLYKDSETGCIDQPCVHRLDMATSGLIVLGLTKQAHDLLSKEFEEHRVIKRYRAIVHGNFPKDISGSKGQWIIHQRLDVNNRPLQIIDDFKGKEAITNWKRIGQFEKEGQSYTKLQLEPITGRTHQLRLTCATNGHSIVGDKLYGSEYPDNEELKLTAYYLEFTHPITKERLNFTIKTDY